MLEPPKQCNQCGSHKLRAPQHHAVAPVSHARICDECGAWVDPVKAPEFKRLGVLFEAMLSPDGTPFLNWVVTKTLPEGVKIIGNGTCTHPLDVELTGAYAVAPGLIEIVDRLVDDLEEAHADELNHEHHGDDPAECTYCKHIATARELIQKAGGK